MKKIKPKIRNQRFQIDQSIKIENTSKTSYVCLANGEVMVCSISAKDKRVLKLFFREIDKPLIFKLFTFSVLCARIIIKVGCEKVMIDREYTFHERQIKSFILQIIRIENLKEPDINFGEIGKNSNAHIGGYNALRQNKSDIKINSREVLKYYEKINKK